MRNRIGRPRFMQSFASAGGGPFLATPPSDGETYGVRNSDTWIEVCEEAPKNGTLYGRISNAWQPIPSGGDPGTASGVLFTPAGNISAVNVQAAIQELDNEKVAKAGGANAIMTGFLTLHADPDAPLKAATKQYVDTALGNAGVTISDTAPTPNQGKMWWESDTGVLWMSYTDASSTQWIGVGGTTAAISDVSKADLTYVNAQDALKVNKSGDTMSGALAISSPAALLVLNKPDTTTASAIASRTNGSNRWIIHPCADASDNFGIARFNDAGVFQDFPFNINRATGTINLPISIASTSPTTGALTVAGGVGIAGDLHVGSSTSASLTLRKAVGGTANIIAGYRVASARWSMRLGDSTDELGSNSGSDFALFRFDDAGTSLGNAFNILRATAAVQFTGDVTITKASPTLFLNKTASGQASSIYAKNGANLRWLMELGSAAVESGSDTGSNFGIYRYNDAGASFISLVINRATGMISVPNTEAASSTTTGALVVNGGVGVGGSIHVAGSVYATTGNMSVSGGIGFTAIPFVTNTPQLSYAANSFQFSKYGSLGTLAMNIATGVVSVPTVVASTSPTTGALVVSGGVGIAQSIVIGGGIFIEAPAAALHINATPSGAAQINFKIAGAVQSIMYDDGPAICISSNSTATAGLKMTHGSSAWVALSDARLPYKRSARDITDVLPRLDQFHLYERTDGQIELFAKAQEINDLFPQLVMRGSDDPDYTPTGISDPDGWMMSYDRLGAIALAYLKQHASRLDALERRLGV